MHPSVLIVEDDADIVELLSIHLSDLDCRVEACGDGEDGLHRILTHGYDLLILDVTLPGLNGIEVCRRTRARAIYVPILMLTARAEENDKVTGLEAGADDYLTKPFGMREFAARVKALLRRAARDKDPLGTPRAAVYRYGPLSIDVDRRRVAIDDRRVNLSPKEFDLLTLLASQPGKCYDRSQILRLVWGYDFDGYEHTVNSHINRLRTKIEPNPQQPTYILTNWGVGYHFNEEV